MNIRGRQVSPLEWGHPFQSPCDSRKEHCSILVLQLASKKITEVSFDNSVVGGTADFFQFSLLKGRFRSN